MAQSIKLYYDLLSQPARALYMFLSLNKIPFERFPVSIQKGEHLSKDYRAINRFRRIPCIVDGNGFHLAETPAIMQYLVRKHPDAVADHWYPRSDSTARARVDEFMSWQHMNLRLPLATYFQYQWLMPTILGKVINPEKLAGAKKNMLKTLDFVEQDYLVDGRFIDGGEKITIADLLAFSELKQLDLTDYNPIEGRPKIQRYMEQVIETTQPEYEEAFQVLHNLAKAENAKAKDAQ